MGISMDFQVHGAGLETDTRSRGLSTSMYVKFHRRRAFSNAAALIQMWIFLSLVSSIIMYGTSQPISRTERPNFNPRIPLTGLVYLRFSGLLYFEDGKLVWRTSEKRWGLGCIMPWVRDTATSSFHVSGESGSNGTRPSNAAEINGVGKHLKRIAGRLMLYPLGECFEAG
jgi:hypothetical protein